MKKLSIKKLKERGYVPIKMNSKPAFPSTGETTIGGFKSVPHAGMSLREYAAIAAMQGLLACSGNNDIDFYVIAGNSVAQADALIKELEK